MKIITPKALQCCMTEISPDLELENILKNRISIVKGLVLYNLCLQVVSELSRRGKSSSFTSSSSAAFSTFQKRQKS